MHMTLRLTLIPLVFLLGTVGSFTSQSRAAKKATTQRVLVIAIDGLRPDGVIRHAPNLHRFGKRHLATWTSKVAIPISAPSWCTIFTGLSHEHTGVTNNAFTGKTLSKTDNHLVTGKKKTVFTHLREHGVSYAVVSTGTWDGIQKIANYGNKGNAKDNWVRQSIIVRATNTQPRSKGLQWSWIIFGQQTSKC